MGEHVLDIVLVRSMSASREGGLDQVRERTGESELVRSERTKEDHVFSGRARP